VVSVKHGPATFTVRVLSILSVCLVSLACCSVITAQTPPPSPRGVAPPLPNTPETERAGVRPASRISKKYDARTPNGRSKLGDVRKDFAAIQTVNYELQASVAAQPSLDYRYISGAVGKIKTLATRLNSNLALGKPQIESTPFDLSYNDESLRASLFSLHRLVIRFVDNPIFKEPGVLNIPQTKRAKQDVDGIMSLSDQIKRMTQQMHRE
jgi:hypothetical protein